MMTYPKELDGETKKITWADFKKNTVSTTKDFLLSFKNITMLKSMINTSLFSGFYKAVKDYLQPILKTFALALPVFMYLHNQKREALVIGLVYFTIYFLSSFASRHSGKLAGKFIHLSLPLNFTLIAGLFFGALAGLFYLMRLNTLAILSYLFVYLIENLRKPMGIAYIGDQLKKNILATSLSAASQLQTIFAALFAVLIGYLAYKFSLGAALILVPLAILVFYPLYFLKAERN